jgi:hypothetical protein
MRRREEMAQDARKTGPSISVTRRRMIRALPLLACPMAAGMAHVAYAAYADDASNAPVVMASSFGVAGDGQTNDRAQLQAAIDRSVGKTLVITGACRIDARGLDLRSGSRVRFAQGASIKLLPHDAAFYQIIRIWDVQNVVLERAMLDGSKELNAAPKDTRNGGYGMGISIAGSSNVTLMAPTTSECWGDGIYIANSYKYKGRFPSAIKVIGHRAYGCRRQGVSIISGSDILFEHPVWENIGGTMPSAGLDIEPNSNLDVLQKIRVVSPTTRNCRTGILMYLQELVGPIPKVIQIEITNHRDESAAVSPVNISGLELNGRIVKGRIVIDSPVWVKPRLAALRSENYDRVSGPEIVVNNQKIIP